ncbi:NAD(P)H-quinone oxidoreductase subunit L, chloroplastic isoform X2 [Cicer arietinum]|uniref:NAD(P)H-quinone oxidoreductase subunit L, chloroplastic isoform X2 n=1 Tax=Cicer arietinum TaxID=3827 RepID=A0A1S2YHM1_CICAR|nr:NAD(P)H-quinone oxidoreductase subunit L, chloroplastic isoform X2 [Cicer arietinum]
MSYSLSLHVPKALPPLPYSSRSIPSLFIASKLKPFHNNTTPSSQSLHIVKCSSHKPNNPVSLNKTSLALPIGAVLLALAEHPAALAVTGQNNNPQELSWILTQLGVVLFFYFLVAPPMIMYWLWKRWYRRKLVEMYFQFMFVFIFFPAIIVWAPFLNFRKFPRDPSLQYPWSIPEDPSTVRNAYSKYPFADPEDYD